MICSKGVLKSIMQNDEFRIIKPFHNAIIFSAIYLVLAFLFLCMIILLLLSGQPNGLWAIIDVLGFLILFYYSSHMAQLKFVVSSLGVEVYRKNRLDYTVRWCDYSVVYYMDGSYIYPVKFIFLAHCELSEHKRMGTALLFSFKLFKKSKLQSKFAFLIRGNDFAFIVRAIGGQSRLIDEVHQNNITPSE